MAEDYPVECGYLPEVRIITQSLLEKKRTFLSVLPYFGIAIMIHVLFNFFTISTVMGKQLVGVVVAVVFALCLMLWIQKRIKVLDSKDKIISPT